MLALRTALSGLSAGLLAVGVALTGAMDRAELGILDRLFEWRGARTPTAPIVIVKIDEDSFDELDMAWPFPRALHARLLDQLSAGQPLAIGPKGSSCGVTARPRASRSRRSRPT